MICQNCRTAIATARYAYGQNAMRRIAPLCADCAGKLTAIGMDLRVERTAATEPVDRRPEWVRRMQAKDMTGSIA